MVAIKLAPSEPQEVFKDDLTAGNWSVHKYTGVDKAHDASYFGKGATIAVVDTVVQYTHEAVSGASRISERTEALSCRRHRCS